MKELSIEEKARAYDKAITYAKNLLNTIGNATLGNLVLKNEFENMFPQLKENEDEKLREQVVYAINQLHVCECTKNKLKSWLEKQCEQKPADKVEPKFKVGDKIQYIKGHGTIMTIEKIENGEYILFGKNTGNTTIEGHTTIENGNKWYLVEQNPAWSEEK